MVYQQLEIEPDVGQLLRLVHHEQSVAANKGFQFFNRLAGQVGCNGDVFAADQQVGCRLAFEKLLNQGGFTGAPCAINHNHLAGL